MQQSTEKRWLIIVYAATIFLSALLLFQVQPIISRYILPWFGGTPAVWTTAMLFFQSLLFAGYAYAHLSVHYFNPRWQLVIHLLLLAAAAASLPFVPSASWKPADGSDPAARILLLLAVSVGLPYFVLSTTGPLVQSWFSRTNPGSSPYRLYSLSNVGSLLALLTYPFVIEPWMTLSSQATVWQWAFWLFAALCGYGAIRVIATGEPTPPTHATPSGDPRGMAAPTAAQEQPPGRGRRVLWLLLPAFASMAFLATTNFVCQDIAVVPFLWIAPLSVYLLSFIICFDHERWYWPRMMATGMLLIYVAAAVYLYLIGRNAVSDKLAVDVGLCFAGLFCLCMLCHGELVRLKPHPRYLTSFYLMISAGGALGGLFVSLIAPLVFSSFVEWYITLVGGLLMVLAILIGTGEDGLFRRHLKSFLPASAILAAALLLAAKLAVASGGKSRQTLDMRRNFYGVLTVQKYVGDDGDDALRLLNGQITHGLQFTDSERRSLPTTYYSRESGVGRAIDFFASQSEAGIRVGAIGLGTGTLAGYARPNDQFVFYEINPEVPKISGQYFTYVTDARERMTHGSGSLKIVMGDARLSLEREVNDEDSLRKFDVIAVDAFSGDAIPTHLLTRQAGDVYRQHLADGGVLAIHISNLHLDLSPVARGLAEYLELKSIEVDSTGDAQTGAYSASWVLLTNNQRLIKSLQPVALKEKEPKPPPLLWTDDYSGLRPILK